MITELNIRKTELILRLTFLIHPGQFQSHRCSTSISPPVKTVESKPKQANFCHVKNYTVILKTDSPNTWSGEETSAANMVTLLLTFQ
jgi:hypothetical protein